ncbi:hypothetical protein KKE78_03055 [Patescibacteria group bacterium]|nr:hypothetical protein [Patescibacteria group bacterium]
MKKIILLLGILIIVLPITVSATTVEANLLYQTNQKVCDRFEEDVSRMAAIMDEVKDRKGITETRVAFGGIDDAIKSADYWVTFAAEAIAYQRAQKSSSSSNLRSGLEVLKGKVLKAKGEVAKAL